MRPSPFRHTLAVLRSIAGLTQKEMAKIAECSTPTIQAIELGKLKLSHELGMRIVFKTGVDSAWLLENQLDKQPLTIERKPYDKKAFEQYQAFLFAPRRSEDEAADELLDVWHLFAQHVDMAASLLSYAYRTNNFPVTAYKIHLALARAISEFVKPEAEASKMLEKAFALKRDADIAYTVAESVTAYFNQTQDEFLRRLKALKKPVPPALAKRVAKKPARRS